MSNEEFENLFGNTPFENIRKINEYIDKNFISKQVIRDKIKELEELNFNNYANEYDNGNEVKYYILKEFKEILGE